MKAVLYFADDAELMMKRSAFGLKVARAAQRVRLAASGAMLRGLRVSDAAPACPDQVI
ncbi:hypothetical protein DPMN_164952 [Dreissena polymorpha]|uniref:Uncharacterized protein n=1 Tax=Dreissena polymorpha TaxID=45954 RepID=A0A9D4EW67_DREPO|nr:hypothetical protein DPMN_164952 [Dreissena polymorpha]